jgi:hypothetical protein
MSKRLVLLATVLLVALPVAADPPSPAGTSTAWLGRQSQPNWLAERAVVPDAPPAGENLASKSGGAGDNLTCTVTEDCDELPDISCSGSTCSAITRNCSGYSCQRGQVTCNGVTTYCSQVCPPNCTFFQCRQACKQPGCVGVCLDTCTCECESICY